MLKKIFESFKKKKQILNKQCDDFSREIDIALKEYNTMFNNKKEFIDPVKANTWRNRYAQLINNVDLKNAKRFKKRWDMKYF